MVLNVLSIRITTKVGVEIDTVLGCSYTTKLGN